MADQQFCLRWNNHQSTLISVFDSLLEGGILVDCTLAAEGKFLRAHKVVLSACSPFFCDLLRQHYEQHPILIMKDVKFEQLKAMLDYMYRGVVNISQDQLGSFLEAAESLQIKGLSDSTRSQNSLSQQKSSNDNKTSCLSSMPDDDTVTSQSTISSPTPRRKKRKAPSGSGDDNEENISEHLHESSSQPPSKIFVNTRLPNSSSPPPAVRDENSVSCEEVIQATPSRAMSLSNSVSYSDDLHHHHPSLMVDNVLREPKSEFIELDEDDDENMAHDAGPSQGKPDGFSWQMDRPEDPFMSSQESVGGQRNAQATIKVSGLRPSSPWPDFHECPICRRLYKYRSTLYRHVRYECGGARMKLVCHICGRRFSRPDNLRQHAITHSNVHLSSHAETS